jgi:hypothetical protein
VTDLHLWKTVEDRTGQFLLQNSLMKAAMAPLENKGFTSNQQKLKGTVEEMFPTSFQLWSI